MNISRSIAHNLLLVLMSVLITACGGGSSGSTSGNGGGSVNTVPTVDAGVDQTVISGDTVNLSAVITDDDTPTVSWTQLSGTTVTLSSSSSADVNFSAPAVTGSDALEFEVTVDDGTNAVVSDTVTITVLETAPTLPAAYSWFGSNVTVVLDGSEVVLEATGQPDHTSCYWNPDNASGLYVTCDPDITDEARMSPGFIEEYNNLFTLRVPVEPTLASSSSATSLGPVGIAVSGAPIFNDQEGPNVDLEIGVISGFDRNGAHTGPSTYHYHLEPKAITNDDDSLVGVIADGFLLFGRKCWSTGDYPTDLDNSGGHVAFTQYTGTATGDEEYHYHIKDEFYLGAYYLLFPEDYQGTPNSISN